MIGSTWIRGPPLGLLLCPRKWQLSNLKSFLQQGKEEAVGNLVWSVEGIVMNWQPL